MKRNSVGFSVPGIETFYPTHDNRVVYHEMRHMGGGSRLTVGRIARIHQSVLLGSLLFLELLIRCSLCTLIAMRYEWLDRVLGFNFEDCPSVKVFAASD